MSIWGRCVSGRWPLTNSYAATRLSPAVGATLARTLELAGYRGVREHWAEGRTDAFTVENMLMFYDEVRDRLQAHGILTAQEIDEQRRLFVPCRPTDFRPPGEVIAWHARCRRCQNPVGRLS